MCVATGDSSDVSAFGVNAKEERKPMADLFLKQASTYAKARPNYPPSLFQMLASLTPQHERAWDVGTGNGQAAAMVAEHYKSVIATDVSEQQLSHAIQRPNVTYSRMSAVPDREQLERIVGPEGSIDLVTVAQALHWFDLHEFYPVVNHVLRKPGGVIAAWCYTLPRVNPAVDHALDELYKVQAPFWAPQRKLVEQEYKSVPFPFEAVAAGGVGPHRLQSVKQWTLDEYLLYLQSSSAVQTALDRGVDLLHAGVRKEFSGAWDGSPDQAKVVQFSIFLLVGTTK